MFKKILPQIIAMLFLAGFAVTVQSAVTDNVQGYAWSSNIGWIKFNGVDYGVNIDPDAGNFSGYAWSENIGWISFNQADLSGCPSGICQAEVDLDTGEVSGWARALANGGGWDGWIKLNGVNYGVNIDPETGAFSGYAWSDMVIGWISFSGDTYGVIAPATLFKQPPLKPLPEISFGPNGVSWDNCSFQGVSIPTFHWIYSDPKDNPQQAYQIQISSLVDQTITSDSTSFALNPNPLTWGGNYSWRVRVQNSLGLWSLWSDYFSFSMPSHAYPYPDFTYNPLKPGVNELISFVDASKAFGSAFITNWSWTFTPDGVPSSSTAKNPSAKFVSQGSKQVVLGVRDSFGYDCGITESNGAIKTININISLPKWKEIPPF
ncbi:MAG: hypothetical protein V1705_01080 [bacterium]